MSARVVLFAYHTLGVRALEILLRQDATVVAVVTHDDDPDEEIWFESVAARARAEKLPVLTPRSPNAPDVSARLRALAPDVFLSVFYRRLLDRTLLGIPRRAALNLHPSLLPAYRGRAPVNWVLVNGEVLTGVTLHHMTEEADAGDIVTQRAVDIAADDTVLALFRKIETAGVAMLEDAWPQVIAGRAPRTPQDHARATVCGRRRPEDGRIAWAWPARRIGNMIRAVTRPFPGAFAGDGAARLRLWAGTAADGVAAGAAAPGTLLEISRAEILVATGEGVLRLTEVQGEGEAAGRADAWARRRALRPGDAVDMVGEATQRS